MIQGYTLATFPNVTQYIYAQPEKQAKELCNIILITPTGVLLQCFLKKIIE